MATVEFSEIFESMKTGVVELAKANLQEYISQATKDGQLALNNMKSDMERWAAEMADGEMDANDLKFLVEGRNELTQMKLLQQAGIAQIQLDKFKNGLVDLVIASISKVV